MSDAEAIADAMRSELADGSSGSGGARKREAPSPKEEPSAKLKKFWSKYVVPRPGSKAGSKALARAFAWQVDAASEEAEGDQLEAALVFRQAGRFSGARRNAGSSRFGGGAGS